MTGRHNTPEYHRARRELKRILTPQIAAGNDVRCVNCGGPVMPDQRWDVGHIIDAAKGGSDSLSNLGAAHVRCNRSAGGRAGAVITNAASRRARRLPEW